MKKLFLSLFLATCLSPLAQADGIDNASYHQKAGDRYLSQQVFDKALKEYSAALAKDKTSYQAWLGKAHSELQLKKWDDLVNSLDALDDVAKSKPQRFDFLLLQAQYYLADKPKHWHRHLKENFFKAKKINDQHPELYLVMARGERQAGKDVNARKYYSKVIELGGRAAATANHELASMFRQQQVAGTGKGWVGDLASKKTINRATLAAVLVDDVEIQKLLGKRSQKRELPADSQGHTFAAAIEIVINTQLRSLALDAHGMFKPNANVTRYELATLIEEVLIAYSKENSLSHAFIGTKSPFPDLKSTHYAYNAAFLAISRGLMQPDDILTGAFAGSKAVSGADLLLVLRRLGSLSHTQ